jgi:heavy metal translocating P-type ATPase
MAKCCSAQPAQPTDQTQENLFAGVAKAFSGLLPTSVAGLFLVASLALMLSGKSQPVDPAWVTAIVCGYPILFSAIKTLAFQKRITSSLLISIAIIAAIAIGEYFAAGEVALIMAVGGLLEAKTVKRAKKGIVRLLALVPAMARKIVNNAEKTARVEDVLKGDILRVLPGEAIPVDGVIVSGATSVDQSIITGESLPVDRVNGDQVFCGTINRFGSIDIRATSVGEDSSLQKLIRLVQDADKNKAPMQRIADKWASWLVPVALAIAIIAYFWSGEIQRAVTVLVVFCPCALVLATPTSIMAAIGQAAKNGIIIKSGDALERMGKIDCVAIDKTGTLTFGNLAVCDLMSFDTFMSDGDLLALAASAESHSEHPLAKAVVAHAKEKGFALQRVDSFKMSPGSGISATIRGNVVHCGNSAYIHDIGITLDDNVAFSLERFRKQGKAIILVANHSSCIGIIALSDTLRPSAKNMVLELKQARADVILMTGDHPQAADYFAGKAGIAAVYSGLLPSQKVETIQGLQQNGRNICMVGDGVNDAPALKTANVGVAMGSIGSDIAIDAADIALMGDDISRIPYLKRLSNATVRLIKFNIVLAMSINFIAIALSVMALLTPVTGALVHNIGSVLVVLNAALLYDRKDLLVSRKR